jgi:cytochrome c-type biogenesis protein CcmH
VTRIAQRSVAVAVATLASLAPMKSQLAQRSDTGTPSAVRLARSARASSDTILEERTRQVAAQLRCPVCQGLSLADSPSELALEMKDVVRQQLAAGRTPDEVKAYFVAKYGEWILLEPPARGVNRLAYALPVAALGGGLVLVWLLLRRWTSGGPAATDAAGTAQDVVD